MAFTLSLIGSIIWIAFIAYILHLYQKPETKVRKRMQLMIKRAEDERARTAKLKQENMPKAEAKISLHKSFYQRAIQPIVVSIEQKLHQFAPSSVISMLENRIFRAGKQGIWSVQRLAAAWIISIAIGCFVALLIVKKYEFLFTQEIIIMAVGAIVGAAFPFLVLNSKIRERQKDLKRQLPEFLDLLCVSVQAGLSFDGAVAKIITRMKGSLTDEFKHMQDDLKFGMTKQYALTQMARRCDLEEIYLFTNSIIQAEKLGTSMSQTLRLQADNMRERHRQYVKTEAMKAPIKIMFPMVLFIFPAIFVVLLLPALLSLMKVLGK